MASPNTKLITPPTEEDIVYPYRRVWRSIGIENSILFVLALGMTLFGFNFRLPAQTWRTINIILACLPLLLWITFSYLPERFALAPRGRLLTVVILSALVANAVGVPLLNRVLTVNMWILKGELIDRIIAYTFSVGVLQEILKYLVIRYTVWTSHFRNRYDSVAYGVAGAIGYATVLNLYYVFSTTPPPDIAMGRIFAITATHITSSIIVAYGLAEIRIGKPSALLVTTMIALASLIGGIENTLRGTLSNTRLLPIRNISGPRTLINLALSAIFLAAIVFMFSFLFNSSERQEREALETADI